jgi:hypothetical protein
MYCGTWTVENGDTVVIKEYAYHISTGEQYSGPATYEFKFDPKGYPNLKGMSNGSCVVKLTNPKR